MTKMGAVNWSTMALAAVVSLLAMENRMLVPHTDSAPIRIQPLNPGFLPISFRYSLMTTSAMAVRAPLMAMPLQGMSLMHSPPMLYNTAARNTQNVPL